MQTLRRTVASGARGRCCYEIKGWRIFLLGDFT